MIFCSRHTSFITLPLTHPARCPQKTYPHIIHTASVGCAMLLHGAGYGEQQTPRALERCERAGQLPGATSFAYAAATANRPTKEARHSQRPTQKKNPARG